MFIIEGFVYLWLGVCVSYGVRRGCVCFEMKINEEIFVKYFLFIEFDFYVVCIGWFLDFCSI